MLARKVTRETLEAAALATGVVAEIDKRGSAWKVKLVFGGHDEMGAFHMAEWGYQWNPQAGQWISGPEEVEA